MSPENDPRGETVPRSTKENTAILSRGGYVRELSAPAREASLAARAGRDGGTRQAAARLTRHESHPWPQLDGSLITE